MLCAECPRCRRRSIIGMEKPHLQLEESAPHQSAPAEEASPPTRLRCDLCGSRAVRIVSFASPIEALRFTTARR